MRTRTPASAAASAVASTQQSVDTPVNTTSWLLRIAVDNSDPHLPNVDMLTTSWPVSLNSVVSA